MFLAVFALDVGREIKEILSQIPFGSSDFFFKT